MTAILNFINKIKIPNGPISLHLIVISIVGPSLPETKIKHMLCHKTGFGGIPPAIMQDSKIHYCALK